MNKYDLSHYGLYLKAIKSAIVEDETDSSGIIVKPAFCRTTLKFESYSTIPDDPSALIEDLAMLNAIKRKCDTDPAVKDSYDKLMTVLALKSND